MNIERNLYLTLQLLELRKPTVVALNMMDEVRANNGSINIELLSDLLGVPVVPISAIKEEGISELIRVVEETAKKKRIPKYMISVSLVQFTDVFMRLVILSKIMLMKLMFQAGMTMQIILDDQNIMDLLKLDENKIEIIKSHVEEMENERGLDCEALLLICVISLLKMYVIRLFQNLKKVKNEQEALILIKY